MLYIPSLDYAISDASLIRFSVHPERAAVEQRSLAGFTRAYRQSTGKVPETVRQTTPCSAPNPGVLLYRSGFFGGKTAPTQLMMLTLLVIFYMRTLLTARALQSSGHTCHHMPRLHVQSRVSCARVVMCYCPVLRLRKLHPVRNLHLASFTLSLRAAVDVSSSLPPGQKSAGRPWTRSRSDFWCARGVSWYVSARDDPRCCTHHPSLL